MVTIEASILAADYARLGEQAREAEAAGVDGIQVDVMDGRFVPDITFGPGVVRALRPLVSVTLAVASSASSTELAGMRRLPAATRPATTSGTVADASA